MLAQMMLGAWSISSIVIAIIVIAAICAILYIILRAMGITLPPWFTQVLLIILAAVVGVVAVKFIAALV